MRGGSFLAGPGWARTWELSRRDSRLGGHHTQLPLSMECPWALALQGLFSGHLASCLASPELDSWLPAAGSTLASSCPRTLFKGSPQILWAVLKCTLKALGCWQATVPQEGPPGAPSLPRSLAWAPTCRAQVIGLYSSCKGARMPSPVFRIMVLRAEHSLNLEKVPAEK